MLQPLLNHRREARCSVSDLDAPQLTTAAFHNYEESTKGREDGSHVHKSCHEANWMRRHHQWPCGVHCHVSRLWLRRRETSRSDRPRTPAAWMAAVSSRWPPLETQCGGGRHSILWCLSPRALPPQLLRVEVMMELGGGAGSAASLQHPAGHSGFPRGVLARQYLHTQDCDPPRHPG